MTMMKKDPAKDGDGSVKSGGDDPAYVDSEEKGDTGSLATPPAVPKKKRTSIKRKVDPLEDDDDDKDLFSEDEEVL